MSEATALSPAQNAPPLQQQAAPPTSAEPSASVSGSPSAPVSGGEQLTTPQPGQTVVGGNGGPDWRAMLAGEDTKALETVSRYKTPADLMKAFNEQRAALSKRAEPVKLSADSTPEQIAEYRKAMELPEIAKDAGAEAYLEAYKVSAPDGYQITDGEKALLGQVVKNLDAKHLPPGAVQAVIGEYFTVQQAQTTQMERMASERRKAWHDGLRDELGSREYDARKNAASQWLQSEFADKPDELSALLTARLPDGGMLGDHPFLFNLIAEKAMGAGFTDRIEASTMESTGKSLAEQQREIEALMFKDRAAYNEAAKDGGKLDKIIALRMSRGELDQNGNEVRRRAAN